MSRFSSTRHGDTPRCYCLSDLPWLTRSPIAFRIAHTVSILPRHKSGNFAQPIFTGVSDRAMSYDIGVMETICDRIPRHRSSKLRYESFLINTVPCKVRAVPRKVQAVTDRVRTVTYKIRAVLLEDSCRDL
ncbi:hypothetical protein ACQ4M3_04820 [Leptolyngbya sp. AN03gr2]|uniref:hypothetical protein n=1 Tax=unclassified Leptolyngbya TaxID=2650499 RepID=UPI003D311801